MLAIVHWLPVPPLDNPFLGLTLRPLLTTGAARYSLFITFSAKDSRCRILASSRSVS